MIARERPMTAANEDRITNVVELSAPPARVWEAITDFKEFGAWFLVDLDQPFEVGGRSTGQMTYPGSEGAQWLAFVEHMEHERLFSFRWYDTEDLEFDEPTGRPAMLVEFQLEETPQGTRLTIAESGFLNLPISRRIELMRGNREGWDIQAKNLAHYLAS